MQFFSGPGVDQYQKLSNYDRRPIYRLSLATTPEFCIKSLMGLEGLFWSQFVVFLTVNQKLLQFGFKPASRYFDDGKLLLMVKTLVGIELFFTCRSFSSWL